MGKKQKKWYRKKETNIFIKKRAKRVPEKKTNSDIEK